MTLKIFMTMCGVLSVLCGCGPSGKFKSVDTVTFGAEISKPGVQVVDVRTLDEYNQGHIPGAVNMDVTSPEFDSLVQTLDKERKVALYCRSGRRSKIAAERVASVGFRVVELEGGILSWRGTLER